MKAPLAADVYVVVPGDPEALTGGYIYDKKLIAALRKTMAMRRLIWPGSYPYPSAADRLHAACSLASLPEGSVVLIDGLAFGALPELAALHAARLRLVALVHHPLAYETGLPPALRQHLVAAERQALSFARHVITTSCRTAQTLEQDFGVPPARLTVALPGSDPLPASCPRHRRDGILQLLSVGSVIPRKGYDVLAAALAPLRDIPWHCTIVGALDRDRHTAAALRAQLSENGLATRVRLAGEVADLAPFYATADLFVLASHYEGYGMAYAEALQHGLPVVGTTGGAIPEVVPATAGLLGSPGDVVALTAMLRALLTDSDLRHKLAAGARRAAAAHPSWADTARKVAQALHAIV